MVKSQARAGRITRWIWLGGAATAAVLALAACGTATAPSSSSRQAPSGSPSARNALQGTVPLGAGPALCAGITQLRKLTVTRVVTLHNSLHFAFPATVTLTDPAKVQAVATAACRLPQLPRVMMTCPADLGISYRLAFAAASRSYPPVKAAATGCAKLTGLDVIRTAVPSFWVTLGQAMNVPSPGASAFGGHPH